MMYNGGFWGMNLIWMGVVFWIFATAYCILRKRYTMTEMTAGGLS